MSVLVTAGLLGLVGGLRTMTGAAALCWGAALGRVPLDGTWLAFLASPWAAWIATILALGEFVTDQLPQTPSRTTPPQFAARLIVGGLGGTALGLAGGALVQGVAGGLAGAVIGTLGGRRVRGRLATAFGRDLPAALIEDAVAVSGALLIVLVLL